MEKYFLRYKNTEYVRSFKDKYEVIDYAQSAFEDILYDFYNDLPKDEQKKISRYATIEKFFSNFVNNWNKYAKQYGYTAITQKEKEKIIRDKNARIINENLKYEQEFDNILQEYLRKKQKNETERDIPYPRWKWRLLISIINLSLTFLKFINTLISVKCAFFFCVIL